MTKKFNNLVWVDYEMFNQNDGFGKVMVKNFEGMGIPLHSIVDFDNINQIKSVLENKGF